jgi:hypothetical protein
MATSSANKSELIGVLTPVEPREELTSRDCGTRTEGVDEPEIDRRRPGRELT